MARRLCRYKGVINQLLLEDGKDVLEQRQNHEATVDHYRQTVFSDQPDITDGEIGQFLKTEAREDHWGRGCGEG